MSDATVTAAPEQQLTSIEVLVKYRSGAYETQTVQGKRASSTSSPTEAVQRLGRKLWGYEPEVQELSHPSLPTSVYLVRLMPQPAAAGGR